MKVGIERLEHMFFKEVHNSMSAKVITVHTELTEHTKGRGRTRIN